MIDEDVLEIYFSRRTLKEFCLSVACTLKHADPQINSERGALNKFTAEANRYPMHLLVTIDANTENLKL